VERVCELELPGAGELLGWVRREFEPLDERAEKLGVVQELLTAAVGAFCLRLARVGALVVLVIELTDNPRKLGGLSLQSLKKVRGVSIEVRGTDCRSVTRSSVSII
jgi:hypothetical protein